MNKRILISNKQASLYWASATAQFHYGVPLMKFGSKYRNKGMIKGKTEEDHSKTLTTTPAVTTHTSRSHTQWIDKWMAYSKPIAAIIAISTVIIGVVGLTIQMYTHEQRMPVELKTAMTEEVRRMLTDVLRM